MSVQFRQAIVFIEITQKTGSGENLTEGDSYPSTGVIFYLIGMKTVAHGPAPCEDPPCGLHMWCVYTYSYM